MSYIFQKVNLIYCIYAVIYINFVQYVAWCVYEVKFDNPGFYGKRPQKNGLAHLFLKCCTVFRCLHSSIKAYEKLSTTFLLNWKVYYFSAAAHKSKA